ncbi:MAG TPA: hypothetical protein VGA16_00525 [Candidatus Limnocylindria bacterium]
MRWQTPVEQDPAPAAPSARACANCRIAVADRGVEHDGKIYCCDGCAEGGPCLC